MLKKILNNYLRRRYYRLIKSEMNGANKLIEQGKPDVIKLL